MKHSFVVLLFLHAATVGYCQIADNTNSNDERNIYYAAIKQYLLQNKDRFTNSDSIYIDADLKTSDSILNECGKFKLVKVKNEELMGWVQKNRSINLIRIFPLRTQGETCSVGITPIGVGYSRNRKRLEFLYGGGDTILFKFDGKQFRFLAIREGGL